MKPEPGLRMVRKEAAELSEATIAGIVEAALEEQALLDRLTDAVRGGDEHAIAKAARAVCHLEEPQAT